MRISSFIFALLAYICFSQHSLSAPMSFKSVSNGGNLASCCWTIAEGEITSETPTEFEHFIKDEFVSELGMGEVRINAFGDDVDAAIKLGRLFRKYRATIIIGKSEEYYKPWHERINGGSCRGVCILTFLGGAQRDVPEGNSISIGQFIDFRLFNNEIEGKLNEGQNILGSKENQILTGKIVEYIDEMGIDPRLYSLSVSVPPSAGSHTLSTTELETLNIENANDTVSDWRAEVDGNGLVAIIDTKLTRRTLRLFCSEKNGYLATISMDRALEPDFDTILGYGVKIIVFSTDDIKGPARIINKISGEGERFTVVFSIDQQTAISIAKTKDLYASAPSVSMGRNWEASLASNFSFFEIGGDKRLPVRILKVCQA